MTGCRVISAELYLLPKEKPRREFTHGTYDEVERGDATSGSPATSIPIAAHEVLQPQTYRLRFRNSHTNAVRLFHHSNGYLIPSSSMK